MRIENAIIKTLPEGKTIKDTTLKVYKQQLLKLFKITGMNEETIKDIENTDQLIEADFNNLIIDFTSKILPYFNDNGFSNNTQKNYVNILIMLTRLPVAVQGERETKYYKEKEIIFGMWEILKGKIFKQMEDNCKDETKFIDPKTYGKKLKSLRNDKLIINNEWWEEENSWKLSVELQDYILLMLYSGKWIRPLRNDYATLSIIHSDSDNNGKNNYLFWNTISNKYKIILNDDKISSYKGGQQYTIKKGTILWKFLNSLVQYRMSKNQNCLLYNPQDRTCMTKNGLTKYLQKLFESWFDKKISSSQLRHIFISNLDFNNLTNKSLSKVAKDMRHSTSTQQFCYKQVDSKK